MNGNLRHKDVGNARLSHGWCPKRHNVIRMVDLTATSSWSYKKNRFHTPLAKITDKIAKPMPSAEYLREHDHE